MSFSASNPPDMRPPSGPYSVVTVAGDLVFVAGQGPFAADGTLVGADCAAQTERVIENIRLALASVGCGLADVVRVGAFLAHLEDVPVFNEVYARHFSPPLPVRTTVEAGLRGFLVELDAIAHRSS